MMMTAETITQVPASSPRDPLACRFCPAGVTDLGTRVFVTHADGCPAVVACYHCDSEVRLRGNRFRVIHTADCPWLPLGGAGAVPCGYRVTHRGPYVRGAA
jgi:hypothetical protein